MKITFDSNARENICYNEPKQHFKAIREKIHDGSIIPFIAEISLSLEAISKQMRKEFFSNYKPSIDIQESGCSGTVKIYPDYSARLSHRSDERLLHKIKIAKSLGFKIPPMTNFGTTRNPDIPPEMKIDFPSVDAFWLYAERLAACSSFIAALGCGFHQYNITKKSHNISNKNFARAVAEWADGDALSAHHAFECDIFCTSDRGTAAGTKSIFHQSNLAKLMKRFNLIVLSPEQLVL